MVLSSAFCRIISPLLSSTIEKFTGRSKSSAFSRSTPRQKELMVLTTELRNFISCSRETAFSSRLLEAASIAFVIRVRNSSAAFRVNVSIANLSALTGGISCSGSPFISLTTRSTSSAVLPLPAAAVTQAERSEGKFIAASCSSVHFIGLLISHVLLLSGQGSDESVLVLCRLLPGPALRLFGNCRLFL